VDLDQLRSVIGLLKVTEISERAGSIPWDPATGRVFTTTGGAASRDAASKGWRCVRAHPDKQARKTMCALGFMVSFMGSEVFQNRDR